MRRRSAPCRTPSTTSTSTRRSHRPSTTLVGRAAAFAERLGLPVRDQELLEQALIHSSYLHEHRGAVRGHNERLEFLGDAVVNLAMSEALYTRHPDDDEGILSARRAAIVSTTGLRRLGADDADRRSWRRPSRRSRAPCTSTSAGT